MISSAFSFLGIAAVAAAVIASPLAPPSWNIPVETGYLPRLECGVGELPDTTGLGAFPGPARILHKSGATGALLERGTEAWDLGPTDTICVIRYVSPALPQPRQSLYAAERVPVLPAAGAAADAGPFAGTGEENPADTGGYALNLSGSKSLAVTLGQGGAVGLDAALFVNVEGQVAENVWLQGSLSDQNVPVQPEGNTTTLREVDTKYLRAYGRQYEYRLGDYTLEYGRAGEDLFSVQAEGARLRYGENGRRGEVLFARSKGLFHSDTLRGVDGKQRGYYLRGRDGSTFITVLAGTERIRRNGAELRRGIDYTIDYSQGRVDFLPGVKVTGENLFSLEYQYTEESYPRLLIGAEARDTLGALRFSLRGIRESEDADNPATGLPDAATLEGYRQLGDSNGVDSLGLPLRLPRTLSSAVLSAEWEGAERGQARFSLLGSLLDKNLYSSRDDDDNAGFSTRYFGRHAFGKPVDRGGATRLFLEPEHEHRSRNFASFHQTIDPRAFRDAWNLDASVGEQNFDANRLRLTLEPWSGWTLGGGAGLASGRLGDSASAASAESRRLETFAGATVGPWRLDASAEAKRATDPRRRDNDRRRVRGEAAFAGWLPFAEVLQDVWHTETPAALIAESELWQPRIGLESPALGDRWIWTTDADALYGRSNYGGAETARRDSLIDVGLSQGLRLISWGPVSGDAYVSRRHHRAWLPESDGSRPLGSEVSVYDQAEANLIVADALKGYTAQTHYRASRTAETPLVESYTLVGEGRGDYAYDSLLNTFYRAETGGDYVLAGLVRDTTLGAQPYQDLQWSVRLELSPGEFPVRLGGFLADADFALEIETDHQDSASGVLPLPRFTDAQIEAVRSGRARYEPSLRWAAPEGDRSAHLRYSREYAKGAGLYAFRERRQESEAEYRLQWNEDWESALNGFLEIRQRQGLTASTGLESRVTGRRAQVLLYRHFPRALTASTSLQYRRAEGEDGGLPFDLQGVVPALRLEKGEFFGGRASGEYGLHTLFGRGEGSYFATEGYRRGVTHRIELLAQSAVQTHLHLNASYLARLEPGASSWSQRFSAEARAVF